MTPEIKAQQIINEFYQPITINLKVHNNKAGETIDGYELKYFWQSVKLIIIQTL